MGKYVHNPVFLQISWQGVFIFLMEMPKEPLQEFISKHQSLPLSARGGGGVIIFVIFMDGLLLNFSMAQASFEEAEWEAYRTRMSQKFPRKISVLHFKKRHHFFNCSSHAIIDVLQYQTIFSLQQRREGAIVIHGLICLYCFGALAILCDHYFCASLEKLCKRWVSHLAWSLAFKLWKAKWETFRAPSPKATPCFLPESSTSCPFASTTAFLPSFTSWTPATGNRFFETQAT